MGRLADLEDLDRVALGRVRMIGLRTADDEGLDREDLYEGRDPRVELLGEPRKVEPDRGADTDRDDREIERLLGAALGLEGLEYEPRLTPRLPPPKDRPTLDERPTLPPRGALRTEPDEPIRFWAGAQETACKVKPMAAPSEITVEILRPMTWLHPCWGNSDRLYLAISVPEYGGTRKLAEKSCNPMENKELSDSAFRGRPPGGPGTGISFPIRGQTDSSKEDRVMVLTF